MILLLLLGLHALSYAASPHEDLLALRTEQYGASYTTYKAIEDKISDIHTAHNHHYDKRGAWHRLLPPCIWQWLVIIMLWLIMVHCYGLMMGRYRSGFYTVILLLSMLGGYALVPYYYEQTYCYGWVTVPKAILRIGPGNDYPPLSSIEYLDECVVIEQRDIWSYVRYKGKQGWMNNEELVFSRKGY
jgi:hypothetical protein